MSPLPTDSVVFYDALVLLGTPDVNQTQKEVRVIAYRIDNVDYWVASDRHDLSAEQIAFVYKLRWQIETFFAWWKRHLKVDHLIARSDY
jgi:IS4 transposase